MVIPLAESHFRVGTAAHVAEADEQDGRARARPRDDTARQRAADGMQRTLGRSLHETEQGPKLTHGSAERTWIGGESDVKRNAEGVDSGRDGGDVGDRGGEHQPMPGRRRQAESYATSARHATCTGSVRDATAATSGVPSRKWRHPPAQGDVTIDRKTHGTQSPV